MRLTILGSGTLVPVTHRNNPGYLLDIGPETIMLDCGSGSIRQIARAGRGVEEVRRLFLSHGHLDHINDLMPLLFTRKYSGIAAESLKPLIIHIHPDLLPVIDVMKTVFASQIDDAPQPYRIETLSPGSYHFPGYNIRVFPASHSTGSIILEFHDERGKWLVYSGDTELCDELVEASQSADCVLIECSFPDSMNVQGHMSPGKISRLIRNTRPRRVILTHLYPQNDRDNLLSEIGSFEYTQVTIAADLAVFEI